MKLDDDLSISALASITKLDRRTTTERLTGIKPVRIVARAKRYRLRDALPALVKVPDSRGGSESESRRLLNDARRELTTLQAEAVRKERIPLDDLESVNETAFRNMRGIILASRLDDQAKRDIFTELRAIGEGIAELGPAGSAPARKPRRKP